LEKNPDWSEKLNIDKEIFKYVPDGTILDGELISDKGRRFIPSLFSNTKKANPIIYIFDIIFYKYEFVGDHPLIKRKELINSIKFLEPVKILNFKKLKDLEEDLRESIKEGHEGIVIKELNSKYILGRDAPMVTLYWKKIKGIRR
jgi:ATP-dependent DNA ligase